VRHLARPADWPNCSIWPAILDGCGSSG